MSSPKNKPSKKAFWTNISSGLIIGILQYLCLFIIATTCMQCRVSYRCLFVLKLKSQDLAPGQGPDEGLVQGMYSVHVQ